MRAVARFGSSGARTGVSSARSGLWVIAEESEAWPICVKKVNRRTMKKDCDSKSR